MSIPLIDSRISVVIITRNRERELVHCLGSLLTQTSSPEEIVVIDNNSQDHTFLAIQNLKKRVRIPLRIVKESYVGYAFARNRGLKEARFRWIAFIDDDCVADRQWIEQFKLAIQKYTQIQAFMGYCAPYYSSNLYSAATNFLQNFWKQNRIHNHQVEDLEILDTKNVVIDKLFCLQKEIQFDTTLTKNHNGGAEDCDFGMLLENQQARARFVESATVLHKDPTSFIFFLRKLFRNSLADGEYEHKWFAYRKKHHSQRYYMSSIRYFKKYVEYKNYSILFSFCLAVLILMSILARKILKQVVMLSHHQ